MAGKEQILSAVEKVLVANPERWVYSSSNMNCNLRKQRTRLAKLPHHLFYIQR
jgi:hypothetical protein